MKNPCLRREVLHLEESEGVESHAVSQPEVRVSGPPVIKRG